MEKEDFTAGEIGMGILGKILRLWDVVTEERPLRMVWRLEMRGSASHLVGTVHFFPYKFQRALKRLMRGSRVVLVEGPLGLEDLREVARKGQGQGKGQLVGLLEKQDMDRIRAAVKSQRWARKDLLSLLPSGSFKEDIVEYAIREMRPWMAFFTLWVSHLEARGWVYQMDRDGYQLAKKMGLEVVYLESLEEQVEALERIPLERIRDFLKASDSWARYSDLYSKLYLLGRLEELLELTGSFPSRCEQVIDTRDKVLYHRMASHLAQGGALAMVGTPHTRAILKWLEEDGFSVKQMEIS